MKPDPDTPGTAEQALMKTHRSTGGKRTDTARSLVTPVLEHTPIAQFAIDADHRVTHWNRACELLTGVAALSAADRDGYRRRGTGRHSSPHLGVLPEFTRGAAH